jgi:hypothetical protein
MLECLKKGENAVAHDDGSGSKKTFRVIWDVVSTSGHSKDGVRLDLQPSHLLHSRIFQR